MISSACDSLKCWINTFSPTPATKRFGSPKRRGPRLSVAVGENVIVREKMSGTHDGVGRIPVNGGMLVGVAPAGYHYGIDTTYWYRPKDGKIADHYAVRDDLKMMQDLGLSPAPAPFDWGAFTAKANTGR